MGSIIAACHCVDADGFSGGGGMNELVVAHIDANMANAAAAVCKEHQVAGL